MAELLKYVNLSADQSLQFPIVTAVESGRSVEPPHVRFPTWFGIANDTESWEGAPFILLFIAEDGRWIDFAPRPTIADAMAEVAWIVPTGHWRECSVFFSFDAYSDERHIPRPVA
jgi:hypothetical protein